MENLMYSLNATVPIFVVILAGWFFRRRGMLNENFVTVANKFNFKVTLPVLLFQDISGMELASVFRWDFVLFCALATTICFFSIWFLARRFLRRELVGSFVQGSFRGSAAVLGVAFLTNIYGDAGMAPLMIVGCVPLYNIYSVLVLTFESGEQQNSSGRIRSALLNICKNPIILGIVAGALWSFLPFSMPEIVDKSLDQFSAIATPLALLAIGAAFEVRTALARIRPTLVASAIKLIGQPLVFLPIAIAMGFRNQELVALLVMLASPSTVSCYIMAKNMGNDGVLAASIVVVTTLLSAVIFTGWLFFLKTAALIT